MGFSDLSKMNKIGFAGLILSLLLVIVALIANTLFVYSNDDGILYWCGLSEAGCNEDHKSLSKETCKYVEANTFAESCDDGSDDHCDTQSAHDGYLALAIIAIVCFIANIGLSFIGKGKFGGIAGIIGSICLLIGIIVATSDNPTCWDQDNADDMDVDLTLGISMILIIIALVFSLISAILTIIPGAGAPAASNAQA